MKNLTVATQQKFNLTKEVKKGTFSPIKVSMKKTGSTPRGKRASYHNHMKPTFSMTVEIPIYYCGSFNNRRRTFPELVAGS